MTNRVRWFLSGLICLMIIGAAAPPLYVLRQNGTANGLVSTDQTNLGILMVKGTTTFSNTVTIYDANLIIADNISFLNGIGLSNLMAFNPADGTITTGNGIVTNISTNAVFQSDLFQKKSALPIVGFDPWVIAGATSSTMVNMSNYIVGLSNLSIPKLYPEFVVVLDEGWQSNRVNGHITVNTTNFPGGTLTNLTQLAHAAGVKIIPYTEPAPLTLGGFTGSPEQYFETDAADFVAWGFDGVRLDMTPTASEENKIQVFNHMVRAFLFANTNRPSYFQGFGWWSTNQMILGAIDGNTSLLGAGDWNDFSWPRYPNFLALFETNKFDQFYAPARKLGTRYLINNNTITAMSYSFVSAWTIFNWPMMFTCVDPTCGADAIAVLTNQYAARIHQDVAYNCSLLYSNGNAEAFRKRLSDGSYAVWLLNRATNVTTSVGFNFQDIGLGPTNLVHDIWLNTNYIAVAGITNSLTNCYSSYLLITPYPVNIANLGVDVLGNLGRNPYVGYTNSSLVLSNLANNPYVAYTNVLTKTATTVSGAGSGSTNYLITLSTNGVNYFYLGSSNVNIYTVAGSTLGSPIQWTAIVTNLSANTWGITMPSGTNRWRYYNAAYGTNRPIVLTNNTALELNGTSDGTNTLVSYYYFAPGL